MTLGAKLKQARADHQLTQQAVATQVAVSRQTISSWETGKSFPDIDSLVTLSNLYGISLDTLIKEDIGMLDYLRKSEILRKLRPIHQSMQILNFLFLIILTFFLPSQLGSWVILAAAFFNLLSVLFMQKFEAQLSSLPPAEQRWQSGWLSSLISNLLITGAFVATYWWPVSPSVATTLSSLALFSWIIWFILWFGHLTHRLKISEDKFNKQKND